MKSLVTSKTFWIAVLQALIGLIVSLQSESVAADVAGYLAMFKSVLDVLLRLATTKGIEKIF